MTEMQSALVVGGTGFVGQALVRALREAGLQRVRSFDLRAHPDPAVESLVGDIRDPGQVRQACAGIDTVFQTAALVDWGPRSRARLFAVNVEGNRNVIAACQQSAVQRLIYTSSIDVVIGGRAIREGDERMAYAARHLDDYGETKAIAERDVLRAHDPNGLQTCALRPAGIYGPGDRHRFPPILDAVCAGKMVYLGDGSARFNHVYITNLVEAQLAAARALRPGAAAGGQAYFIVDHPPSNFYDFFTPYLKALGHAIPTRRIPLGLAYGLALLLEGIGRAGIGPQPPLLTRYVVLSTCLEHSFSAEKARRDLGYQPVVAEEQAFEETLAWLRASEPPCSERGVR